MTVVVTEDKALTTLAPDGPLERELGESLEQNVEESLERGRDRFLLNIQRVPHARSAGLESIVRIARRIADIGGRLAIIGANEVVTDILRATRLDRRLAVFDSTEAAMYSMTSEG